MNNGATGGANASSHLVAASGDSETAAEPAVVGSLAPRSLSLVTLNQQSLEQQSRPGDWRQINANHQASGKARNLQNQYPAVPSNHAEEGCIEQGANVRELREVLLRPEERHAHQSGLARGNFFAAATCAPLSSNREGKPERVGDNKISQTAIVEIQQKASAEDELGNSGPGLSTYNDASGARKRLSSSSSQVSSRLKNVASKCRESWSGENFPSKDNLNKMIKQRYMVLLFLLSALMVACLLATLVISRSVGQLDQEESSKDPNSQQLKSLGALEPLELRQLELVDLVECDKTFAYTRWRLQIRVPKSAPTYKQSNHFTAPQEPDPASAAAVTSLDSIHAESKAAGAVQETGEGSEISEQYFLTSTNDFVNGATPPDRPTEPLTGGELAYANQNTQSPSSSRTRNQQMVNETTEILNRDSNNNLREQVEVFDPQDPLQFAASEMKLSLSDASNVNGSVIDCFIVDTEKRLDQKLAVEALHRRVTITRRVEFSKMLAVIQACRQLTWDTLRLTPRATSKQSARANRPALRAASSREIIRTTLPVNSKTSLSSGGHSAPTNPLLGADIVPVSARRPISSGPGVSANEPVKAIDPFGNILGMMFFWGNHTNSRSLESDNANSSRVRRALGSDDEAMERAGQTTRNQSVARIIPTQKLMSTTTASPSPRYDEEDRASYFNMGMSMISGIVPNTLWCGLGDRAANYSELGAEYQVDSCCRAHDHCPIRLKPFTADYGLINWSMSTRSHCDCDLDFNDCLSKVNSALSNVIKNLYFRFVGLQCIDIEQSRLQIKVIPTTNV